MSTGNQLIIPSGERSDENMFTSVTPAMVYQYLRENTNLPTAVDSEYAVPVELPGTEELMGKMWHPNADAYFVQATRLDTGVLVDAGVVVDKKASPDLYVVTASNETGEYSVFPFSSQGNPGSRTIGNVGLGLSFPATLEDILDFGSSWTPDQTEKVLKTAVQHHYKDQFPMSQIASPITRYLKE